MWEGEWCWGSGGLGGGLIHDCVCSPCVLGVEVFRGGKKGGWVMVVAGGSGVGGFLVGK